MNADKICSAELKEGKKELIFNEFIVSFKIDYYQRLDEPDQFDKCTEENTGMRMDVLSKGRRSQNMFTRSSNWRKDEENKKLSARYMVGNNIKSSEVEAYEFKDFIFHFDLQDMHNI